MALVTCRECGRQVSDQAAACPGCGAPVSVVRGPLAPVTRKEASGCFNVIAVVGLVALLALVFKACSDVDSTVGSGSSDSATQVAIDPAQQQLRESVEADYKAMPLVLDADWVRPTEFTLVMHDTGKDWQALADKTCSALRARGITGSFSVDIIEAEAARNRRMKQLGHARCG